MITEWITPATSYPLAKHGDAEIVKLRHRGWFPGYGVKGCKLYQARTYIRALKIRGKIWMVDDPPHWWAMEEYGNFFSGHVLCAGLGLGLMVHALDKNDRVSKITVIERELDVIKLVAPHLPKCEIVHGDFWCHQGKVDGVLFDLFVGNGMELVGQALRTFVLLLEKYPDAAIRIHGFPDQMFNTLRTGLEEARNQQRSKS